MIILEVKMCFYSREQKKKNNREYKRKAIAKNPKNEDELCTRKQIKKSIEKNSKSL